MTRLDQDHLPKSAMLLADVIGLPATLALVEAWPGLSIVPAKGATRSGAIRFEALSEIVGHDNAEALWRYANGQTIYIPACKRAITAAVHGEIREKFDARTAAGESARSACAALALEYRYAERHVWRVLKEMYFQSAPDHVKQAQLF